jgi:hypothetical protein
MDSKTLKILGIVCLVICGICLFIAVERYQDNASKVNAMKEMGSDLGIPGGGLLGGADIQPATPTATKYAAFFGLLFAVGGAIFLWKSATMGAGGASGGSVPPEDSA